MNITATYMSVTETQPITYWKTNAWMRLRAAVDTQRKRMSAAHSAMHGALRALRDVTPRIDDAMMHSATVDQYLAEAHVAVSIAEGIVATLFGRNMLTDRENELALELSTMVRDMDYTYDTFLSIYESATAGALIGQESLVTGP